ncbi:hypothetical protein SZN_09216 [Streptomyces zinciresistens K42]|uniref:Uncharacterized protein n=1 Tax=Streptomyces zinciresistens K42 TaxID=700597 RepID=G2G8M5_9ACTN|nr:hypothetical protein [Streptomyces zinciresistens]EGX60090.1 hypothetical protein SZN_09216 [Streptomyces zinciresistens K42]
MIIIYTPGDGAREEHDARSLRISEASIAQRTAGMKWADIEEGLGTDDPEAMRVVVWVLKKRAAPSLRYGDFDPLLGELTTRMDRGEVADYIRNAFAVADADPGVDRDQVAVLLRQIIPVALDPEHAERLIAETQAGPKDPAPAAPQPEAEPMPGSSPTPTSTSAGESGSPSSPTSSTSPRPESTT